MNEADVLVFGYRHANGEVRVRWLSRWKEEGFYLKGVDADTGMPRTYRKDQIEAYVDGCEEHLADPFPTTPSPPPARRQRAPESTPHVLFTGFPSVQRAAMEAKAAAIGMHVCDRVTQACGFVVTGPNAGPAKVARATLGGKMILSWPQFLLMLDTGELPPDDDTEDGLTNC